MIDGFNDGVCSVPGREHAASQSIEDDHLDERQHGSATTATTRVTTLYDEKRAPKLEFGAPVLGFGNDNNTAAAAESCFCNFASSTSSLWCRCSPLSHRFCTFGFHLRRHSHTGSPCRYSYLMHRCPVRRLGPLKIISHHNLQTCRQATGRATDNHGSSSCHKLVEGLGENAPAKMPSTTQAHLPSAWLYLNCMNAGERPITCFHNSRQHSFHFRALVCVPRESSRDICPARPIRRVRDCVGLQPSFLL